jgi:hypothetical protein
MNVNSIIIGALSSLNMPVEPDSYTGAATDYITFNYADERPAIYVETVDVYDETSTQIHYFTKSDPQTNKKAIRRLLRAAGFTITGTVELYESDTKYHHIVVEATTWGTIND